MDGLTCFKSSQFLVKICELEIKNPLHNACREDSVPRAGVENCNLMKTDENK